MISVILATHNGEETLPLTLEALSAVRLPDSGVEFIAVDNASNDGSARILRGFQERLPLSVLFEPRPGKSFALNRALQQAQGDLIVFTDDDVIPSQGWLEAYAWAAQEHPDVSLFAGQVRHFWQKKPPQWLERLAAEGRSFAGTPVSLSPGPVRLGLFKGLNFMVRRASLDAVRFCEDAGVNFTGTFTSAGGEDTRLIYELLQQGEKSWYVPDACLQHIVRPHQVGVQPVLQRYFRIGRASEATGVHRFPDSMPRFLGYPRYLFKTIPLSITHSVALFACGRTYKAMDKMIRVATSCGQAVEWRKTYR